jgi:hypothetical protein
MFMKTKLCISTDIEEKVIPSPKAPIPKKTAQTGAMKKCEMALCLQIGTAGRIMNPITTALKSAKLRIEEAAGIEEKSLNKAPYSSLHKIRKYFHSL